MAYRVTHLSSFAKDIKASKKQKEIMEKLPVILEAIMANPQMGEPLLTSWEGFRRVSFGNRPQMRVIFKHYECCSPEVKEKGECRFGTDDEVEISDCNGQIDFAFLRTREDCNNLYGQNRKYSDHFRRE